MSNGKIPAKICKFWIDQWRPWSQSICTKREGGGHVKFYTYEKGGGAGGKCFSHAEGGGGGGGHKQFPLLPVIIISDQSLMP